MAWTRRQFVSGASALGASTALGLTGCPHQSKPFPTTAPPGTPGYVTVVPPQLPTLRQAGAARNLLAGCAVSVPHLRHDDAYAQLVRQQAGIVVAESAMKFGPLRPTPDTFFFDDADLLFTFAEANGMKVRGHNFVWHRQLPRWFDSYVTAANAQAVLVNHIQTVGRRYAGRVQSWDVVNEAIQVSDNRPSGLRNSPWFKLLGPTYIDLAYRTAREADPTALLCYNDYGIEGESAEDAAKRAAVLDLVRGMQRRNVPIDAVGIQSHISAGKARYGAGLQQFMHQVQGMGLKLMLTEMDVNARALPADPATRDNAVAEIYRDYLNLTLANTDVIALLTWGITDRFTWLNGEDSRPDKLPDFFFMLVGELSATPAYVSEVQAIQHTPPRPS